MPRITSHPLPHVGELDLDPLTAPELQALADCNREWAEAYQVAAENPDEEPEFPGVTVAARPLDMAASVKTARRNPAISRVDQGRPGSLTRLAPGRSGG